MVIVQKEYNIKVTEKQLDVIRDACELYGRVQIGQFLDLAEIICRAGFRNMGSTVDDKALECAKEIQTFLDNIWTSAGYKYRERAESELIALDIWAVLDKRREGSDFCMGTEPNIKVVKVE